MRIHIEGGKDATLVARLDAYVEPFRPQFKRVKLSDREFAPRECSPVIAVQPSELTRHTHQNLDALDIVFLKRLASAHGGNSATLLVIGKGPLDRPTPTGTHATQLDLRRDNMLPP